MSNEKQQNRNFILIISTLIGGILAALFTLFLIPTEYNATAELNVQTEEAVDPSIYEAIIKSDKVVQELKEKEHITIPVEQLKKRINVKYNEENNVLNVSLSLDNRRHSVITTDVLAEIATDEIEEFVQGSTVEYVKNPEKDVVEDTSLKAKLIYIIIGLLAGFGIGFVITTLRSQNKQDKKEPLEEKYTVLGSIPKY